jgi:hypothetical protein
MRRLVTLILAASMLALPAGALAQSAGDEQYADPFGPTEQPENSQGQQAQAPEQEVAPAPTPAAEPAAPAEEATASQETAAPTLPATGLPAAVLAAGGALLLAGGTTLRRLVS